MTALANLLSAPLASGNLSVPDDVVQPDYYRYGFAMLAHHPTLGTDGLCTGCDETFPCLGHDGALHLIRQSRQPLPDPLSAPVPAPRAVSEGSPLW